MVVRRSYGGDWQGLWRVVRSPFLHLLWSNSSIKIHPLCAFTTLFFWRGRALNTWLGVCVLLCIVGSCATRTLLNEYKHFPAQICSPTVRNETEMCKWKHTLQPAVALFRKFMWKLMWCCGTGTVHCACPVPMLCQWHNRRLLGLTKSLFRIYKTAICF